MSGQGLQVGLGGSSNTVPATTVGVQGDRYVHTSIFPSPSLSPQLDAAVQPGGRLHGGFAQQNLPVSRHWGAPFCSTQTPLQDGPALHGILAVKVMSAQRQHRSDARSHCLPLCGSAGGGAR